MQKTLPFLINNETQKFLRVQDTVKPLFDGILWNVPEQKSGILNIIGGSANGFANLVRVSEFARRMPFEKVYTVMPESTRKFLPIDVMNVKFAPATSSGSFDDSMKLSEMIEAGEANLFLGEMSKNSVTAIAMAKAIAGSQKLCIIARDTLDLVTVESANFLEKENVVLVASILQLQKILRAVYFPKMLLLSAPLLLITEVLHKFTLSYGVTILTYAEGNIIVAKNGEVVITKIEFTKYTPMSLWSGELAVKIAGLAVWSSGKIFEATVSAIIY